MPASIAAKDLLIAFGRTGGAQTFNLPTDWNWAIQNNVADATDDASSVIWRIAAGGDTLSWDLSGSAKGAVITYRITGHNFGLAAVPTPTTFTTTLNTCDPPATGALTLDDYLVIEFGGMDGETQTFSASTNYVGILNANSGTGGLPATNCRIGAATRQLLGITSEDPGIMNAAAAQTGGLAITIAIREAVPPVDALVRVYPRPQAVMRAANW